MDSPNAPALYSRISPIRRVILLAALLALLFAACSLPVLSLLSRYRGDEGLYTNAAIRMIQTHDYLTPYFDDGRPRFNKPPLNYWLISGSFQVLGINVFASRLPSLLAACLSLLAVARLAWVLFEDERIAVAAPAILLTNEEFLNASIRATTDIVQVLFLAIAWAGLAAIVLRNRRSRLDYFAAFGGLALAMMTKGGLALLTFAFAVVFAIAHARLTGASVRNRLFNVLRPSGLAIMFVPLLFWFGLNVWYYGPRAISGFWNDQVGNRLEGSPSFFLQNLLSYTTAPALTFLPWALALAAVALAGRTHLHALLAARKGELLFISTFLLTLVVILLFGNITRTRYLLPAYPLLASGLAYLLIKLPEQSQDSDRTARTLSVTGLFVALAFAGVLTLLAVRLPILGAIPPVLFPILLAVLAAAGVAILLRKHTSTCGQIAMVAVLLLVSYRFFDLSARRHFFVTGSYDITNVMKSPLGAGKTLASVGLSTESDQVRMLSAGEVQVQELPANVTRERLRQFPAVLLSESTTLDLGPDYQQVPVQPRAELWRPADLFRLAMGSRSLPDLQSSRAKRYRLLIQTPPPADASSPRLYEATAIPVAAQTSRLKPE